MDSKAAKVLKANGDTIIDIAGDQFILDTRYAMLIDKKDPMNCIAFHDMNDQGGHYELLYDREQRNLAAAWEPGMEKIMLPQMVELDPGGMAAKYNTAIDSLPKHDHLLRMDEQDLMLRLEGRLPQLSIEGQLYTVDLHSMQLREQHGNSIDLSSLMTTFDGRFMAYRNAKDNSITNLDNVRSDDADNVKMLMLPSREWLDPVFTARSMGLPETALQKDYPAMLLHKARSFPLSESARLVIAEINDTRRQQKQEVSIKTQRPKQRKGRKI
jgi:hypothetical protein